jgi:8-oxo-dGTP pyrophosphatase MutT (NUDIX family)
MSGQWEEDGDPWIVKSTTRPFENEWFALDRCEVVRPDGRDGTYTVVRPHRLAVGVLPIEPDGTVHLVGQWRFPLGRYSWEMPEGGAEPHEDPLECAKRELAEETGLTAGRFEQVLEMDISNSLTDERAIIYLAFDLIPGEARPDGTEVLKRRRASFLDVLERVAEGRIRDGMTVAAVLRAHHMAVTGALPESLARAMLAGREGEKHGR